MPQRVSPRVWHAPGHRIQTGRVSTEALAGQSQQGQRGPAAKSVQEVARFEGISDPADEAIVLALHCREDGVKGTFTVPFGPGMGALDAEMMRRLRDTPTRE